MCGVGLIVVRWWKGLILGGRYCVCCCEVMGLISLGRLSVESVSDQVPLSQARTRICSPGTVPTHEALSPSATVPRWTVPTHVILSPTAKVYCPPEPWYIGPVNMLSLIHI